MTIEQVKELAQGRIYSGLQAIELGLVDQLGGMHDAIDKAAEMAGLEKYYVRSYPPQQDFFKKLLEQADDAVVAKAGLSMDPALQQVWSQWQYLKQVQGIQQRLPFIWQVR
jgi:protease-4